jgi:hypothetical protein
MPQKLHLAKAGVVEVDRIFQDGGASAHIAMMGGQRVEVSPGKPPMMTVAQKGKAFFFLDARLTPVKMIEDIAVIPASSPFRKDAEDFIALQQQGGKKAEAVIKKAKVVKPRTLIRQHLKMHELTKAADNVPVTPGA